MPNTDRCWPRVCRRAGRRRRAGGRAIPPLQTFGEPTLEQLASSIHVWDPTGHVEVIETETTEGDETVLSLDSDILFAFGSADLPPSAGSRIAELICDVPQGVAVSITGHTDDIGTDDDNLVLSQQRADAVATAIAAARSDLRLDVEGLGESEPVESNQSPRARSPTVAWRSATRVDPPLVGRSTIRTSLAATLWVDNR